MRKSMKQSSRKSMKQSTMKHSRKSMKQRTMKHRTMKHGRKSMKQRTMKHSRKSMKHSTMKHSTMKGGNVNYTFNPANYGSSEGGVKGVGCAGTKYNADAAAAVYKQNGGKYVTSYSLEGTPVDLLGPKAGHPALVRNFNYTSGRDMHTPFPNKLVKLNGGGGSGGSYKKIKQIGCKRTGGKKKHSKHYYRGGSTAVQEFNTNLTYENSALASPPPLSRLNQN